MDKNRERESEGNQVAGDQQHGNTGQHSDEAGHGQMGSHQIGDFQMTAEEKESEVDKK